MSFPKAVASSVLTPGLYLQVNLVAGASSPGTGVLRVLLISPQSSDGDLEDDVEIRSGGGEATAATAFGSGTPGHLAAAQIYGQYPVAQVDFAASTAGAGTADGDVVFTGTPDENIEVKFEIAGTTFSLAWLASETADEMRDKLITQVAALTKFLPVAASNGGAGTVTLAGKVTGKLSNDVLVRATLLTNSGTAAVTPATYTALTGGTTDADPAAILANAVGTEYHFIVFCTSNADAESASATSGPGKVITHVEGINHGLDAKLQTAMFASTGTLANAKTGAIAHNSGFCEHVLCVQGRSLPCEFAGREVGGWLAALSIDADPNRIGDLFDEVAGSGDVIGDKPTAPEVEDALGNGVAIVSYTAQGKPFIVRPITTYSQDANAGADRRLLDATNTHATYIVSRDIRDCFPQQFPKAKIMKDIEPGEEPPPKNVIEERDVKTSLVARLRFWVREGIISGPFLDEALADGSLIVAVDDSDATQLNIVIPEKVIPLLAKIGVVVERRPN